MGRRTRIDRLISSSQPAALELITPDDPPQNGIPRDAEAVSLRARCGASATVSITVWSPRPVIMREEPHPSSVHPHRWGISVNNTGEFHASVGKAAWEFYGGVFRVVIPDNMAIDGQSSTTGGTPSRPRQFTLDMIGKPIGFACRPSPPRCPRLVDVGSILAKVTAVAVPSAGEGP